MPFRTHEGVTFHTQEVGSGPPVIFLHGLFVGSIATWYFTTAPVVAKSHRVLLFDLRGHGKSSRPPSGYGVATMAGDLEALANEFSYEPLSLVGHSYGAAVALHFAAHHPARIKKLVLVEAPHPPSSAGDISSFLALSPSRMADALPEDMRARDATGKGKRGRRTVRFVDHLTSLTADTSLLAELAHAETIPDAILRRIACPVLCIYGRSSACLPAGEHLAVTLPNAQLQVVDGGHFLPIDAPQALTEYIDGFLRG